MVNFEMEPPYTFEALCQLMSILRSKEGCPWDAEQTHQSVRDNLLEEACEAMEAIDLKDDALLCEELGDVLLQVVFHADMAASAGSFTITDVTHTLCTKLLTRHPHVFGETRVSGVSDVLTNWETIKRETKGQTTVEDAMRHVAATLPPVMRAQKLQKLAKRAELTIPQQGLQEAMEAVRQAETALTLACEAYIQCAAKEP